MRICQASLESQDLLVPARCNDIILIQRPLDFYVKTQEGENKEEVAVAVVDHMLYVLQISSTIPWVAFKASLKNT